MSGHKPWSEIKHKKAVSGYMFTTVGGENEDRNETVCQIIERVEGNVNLENGPTFWVRFGDGHVIMACTAELHPWFAT